MVTAFDGAVKEEAKPPTSSWTSEMTLKTGEDVSRMVRAANGVIRMALMITRDVTT